MADEDPAAAEGPVVAHDLDIAGLEGADEIGIGGFATVYKAFQPAFQRTVAVKVITTAGLDDAARVRFERECQTMGSLSEHPNIVTVYGAGFTDLGQPYLVMAFLPGGSLQDQIDEHGTLTWQEATLYGVHLAGALETAHRAQIVHRDIKPGNILMSQYGDAQLTDFGIARVAGGHETRTGSLAVSLAHAPPEILDGQRPTFAADVYSLGSTIYEALAGVPAFSGDDNSLRALLRRILNDPVPDLRLRGIPDEVCAVIERAMSKDPAARQPSALRFGIELQEARRILGEDPGRLTVPDMRAGGKDIQFVQAGASPLRSKGAVFDLDQTVPADPDTVKETREYQPGDVAPKRRGKGLLIGAGIVAALLIALVAGVLLTRGDPTPTATAPIATGGTATSVVTLPPRTIVEARYSDNTRNRFVDACIKNEANPRPFCLCVYENIEKDIPYTRFLEINTLIAEGAPLDKTDVQPIIDACSSQIPGRAPPPTDTTAAPPPT